MRKLVGDDYLKIIKNRCVEITDIRTEDERKISDEVLEKIIKDADKVDVNYIDTENQRYCVSFWNINDYVAVDMLNKTSDKDFFKYFFIGEMFDYVYLSELLKNDKVFPMGIIENGWRKQFKSESLFNVQETFIEVSDNSYPYKIYKDAFLYCRNDYNNENFGLVDRCIFIYYKDGRSARLFIDDYAVRYEE